MSDDKQHVGMQDTTWIDANDPSEIEYMHQQFPWVKREEIVKAIKEKGPIRDNVIEYLGVVKSHRRKGTE